MKTYISLILIAFLAIISCKEEVVPKPDNLLSKEKMAAILYDITLINSVKGVNRKELEDSYMHLDAYIYQKHAIDSLTFLESNNFYAANPMQYDEIYGMVQARLTKERQVVGTAIEAEQKRKDSIQKARIEERKKKDTITKKDTKLVDFKKK